jgi:hypothetical protein
MSKGARLRTLLVFLGFEILLFLVPTEGRVEGVARSYWDGVGLRLLSGHYWIIALLSGIGCVLLMEALSAFSNYLGRFAKPPSNNNRADGP